MVGRPNLKRYDLIGMTYLKDTLFLCICQTENGVTVFFWQYPQNRYTLVDNKYKIKILMQRICIRIGYGLNFHAQNGVTEDIVPVKLAGA